MKTFDGNLLPGEGRAERPEKRSRLAEAVEGKQVALLSFDDGPGPTGSPMMLLEFTDGSGLIVMAGRDRNSRYAARVLLRTLPAPKIWTPSRERKWRFGHEAAELAETKETDPLLADLQQRVEGAMIEGIRSRQPDDSASEQMAILFKGGAVLTLTAKVLEKRTRTGLLTADLLWEFTAPDRPRMVWP